MYDPHALKLYVDGSALKNPGKGGYSVVAEYPDSFDIAVSEVKNGSYTETTNNRMELRAVIEAMKFARTDTQDKRIRRVIIISDSLYVCDNQNSAVWWKKNNWRNSEGRPMDNHDLWDEFLKLRPKIPANVEIVWEKGKTRAILKEVDKNAKNAASSQGRTDFGFRKPRIARTKVKGPTASMFNAHGQTELIRVFKYEYRDKTELEVTFDLYSPTTDKFDAKYFAYLDADVFDDLHRHSCYRAIFNENPKYPKFVHLEPVTEEAINAVHIR
ncbi:MAG: RNase H family protein [bacterium]|nr:RNase H family protein [bacterium]